MSVTIRAGCLDDLPVLVQIYNHYVEHTAFTFDKEPWTVETRRPWFDQFATVGRHRLLVAVADTTVLGYTCSARFHPKAAYETSIETSIYLARDCLGRGLGVRLYHALFHELAGEDVHRAYAGITVPNPASVALHRKLGFARAARYHEAGRKFGRYWSVEWFEKSLSSVPE